MAASTINVECKRYGCMKNLLACFANCRYAPRCDELRNELADKTAAAESDIKSGTPSFGGNSHKHRAPMAEKPNPDRPLIMADSPRMITRASRVISVCTPTPRSCAGPTTRIPVLVKNGPR